MLNGRMERFQIVSIRRHISTKTHESVADADRTMTDSQIKNKKSYSAYKNYQYFDDDSTSLYIISHHRRRGDVKAQ